MWVAGHVGYVIVNNAVLRTSCIGSLIRQAQVRHDGLTVTFPEQQPESASESH